MDPEVIALQARLAEAAIKTSGSAIYTRVAASRTKKRNEETIEELVEMIDELIRDRDELKTIANSMSERLVAQKLTGEDISYINQTVLPTLERLFPQMSSHSQTEGSAREEAEPSNDGLSTLKALLSPELLTIAQLLGFNFRDAIGRPLTDLSAAAIRAQIPKETSTAEDIQRLQLEQQVEYLKVVQDSKAYERLQNMGRSS